MMKMIVLTTSVRKTGAAFTIYFLLLFLLFLLRIFKSGLEATKFGLKLNRERLFLLLEKKAALSSDAKNLRERFTSKK